MLWLDEYDGSAALNAGSGEQVSIGELAKIVASVVGFEGKVNWDSSKPSGTKRKSLDSSQSFLLGL